MERLWTPWRKAFVENAVANAETGCFLCEKPRGGDDRANLILARGERVFVLLNLYPYNTGHLLVAPFAHTGDYAALDAATANELTAATQHAVGALRQAYRPDAFNVGLNLGRAGGAGLPDHLHVHVVPRWSGDGNFMTVVADTKVLPETLDQSFDRLAPLFPRPAGQGRSSPRLAGEGRSSPRLAGEGRSSPLPAGEGRG